MFGSHTDLHIYIKEVAPHVDGVIAVLTEKSIEWSTQSAKVVNSIKADSTDSRLYKSLCEVTDCLYTTLVLYTEVRWISWVKVPKTLYELRHEVRFLKIAKFHESE